MRLTKRTPGQSRLSCPSKKYICLERLWVKYVSNIGGTMSREFIVYVTSERIQVPELRGSQQSRSP